MGIIFNRLSILTIRSVYSRNMPSIYGGPITTFEDAEKESEYGYIRKGLLY
ncbi:hypothetical protein OROHE_000681 [Orobanche hederae]